MGKTALFVRRTPGGLFTITDEGLTTGSYLFVHSVTGTDAAGYGNNPDSPLATLDYANNLATASKADRIYLLPGHVENITAAGTVTLDTIGVQVIGLGRGALRPTFSWTTINSATIVISAASVLVKNCIFDLTGVAAVVTGFSVTGADVTIEDCYILQTDAGQQAAIGITLGAAAHRFQFLRNYCLAGTAGGTSCIYHAGGATDVTVQGSTFNGDWSNAAVFNDTALMLRLQVLDSVFNCTGAAGIGLSVHANTTGNAIHNHSFVTANIAAGGSITAAAMFKSECFGNEAAHVAASSQIDPLAGAFA